MILIWSILSILSIFALIHIIILIFKNSDFNEMIVFMFIYLFFIGLMGWTAIGITSNVKTIDVKLNKNDINITKTKTTTIITYKDVLYDEFTDVKTYLYCNKDSCDFYMILKINMYNSINKKNINIKYK